ncbi:MAG: YggS family pyridoxal phosphate-dependent enzyme [Myxococcaceae bacterium]|nr:YggS family pyridoxal phosphate-dependent enzyme [Myxococcaceae bacterium]MCI0672536.1 YggS family pyridoxal phosphate-dependent enzyme [Myxococcaceae bacterium]
MSGIGARLEAVHARITAACARAGRRPGDVTLLAVSKLKPAQLIREAHALGLRDFGENYAQELRDKAAELADLEGLRWHAIGPLQTNKAKYVAKVAHAFHALDRLEVAQELSRRRTGAPLRCFLEVNVGGEATKGGVAPQEARALFEQVRALPNLELVGLMCLPPPGPTAEASRASFQQLRALAQELGLPGLSMGTTGDFEVAIEEGATHVRVGTALFGER